MLELSLLANVVAVFIAWLFRGKVRDADNCFDIVDGFFGLTVLVLLTALVAALIFLYFVEGRQ